jgi:6,7-dimethyl-8-ribityllumazine synthase
MISQGAVQTFTIIPPRTACSDAHQEASLIQHTMTPAAHFGASLKTLRIGIITSRFNTDITEALRLGAVDALQAMGLQPSQLLQAWVSGAVELPLAAQWMAQSHAPDAIICLGCVIRGDTDHYQYVCDMATRGIQKVSLSLNIPVAFGVLTCNTLAQALARTVDDWPAENSPLYSLLQEANQPPVGNKGREAAHAVLDVLAMKHGLAILHD